MMLLRNDEIIKEYDIDKDLPTEMRVSCWIKEEMNSKFKIHIFVVETELQGYIKSFWDKVNNNIAISFQSTLEKSIERWNLYLIYVVKDKIKDALKYEIEQNKYSTRKIIFDDNFNNVFGAKETERDRNIMGIIQNKLFTIEIGQKQDTKNIGIKQKVEDISPRYARILIHSNEEINRVDKLLEEIKNEEI